MLPGQDTLIACWVALASNSPDARVVRSRTSVAAIFPAWTPLNNAIAVAPLEPEPTAKRELPRLAAEYANAGVETWAYWIPSFARAFDARDEIVLHGVARDTTTLVMTAALPDQFGPDPAVRRTSVFSAVQATDVAVPVAELDAPEGVRALDAWVLVVDGMAVSGAWTFRHGADCGVYGVGTVPELRRRGFARRLMEHVLDNAAQFGARTASLQSTAMGQRLYESLGFLPVGRYEEWLYTATES
jgi:GNAT superfamily N-acetyltransferase